MKIRLALVGIAALSCLAFGCAAPTSDDAASGDDDITARQLPGVVAVEVAQVRTQTEVLSAKTLGAPKKVKAIVTAVKKLKPTEPQPRCLERDTTRLTFLDAASKKVATVDTHCGGFGSISFESGREGYAVRFDTQVVEDAKAAPFAVGDALWGISKIVVSKPGGAQKHTLTGEAIAPVVDGFDLDQVPDPKVLMPRCLPSHVVSLERANHEVAYTSFFCGSSSANAPASIRAHFSAVDLADPKGDPAASGGITIDPRPILKALEGSN
jgi:hypothetical protein